MGEATVQLSKVVPDIIVYYPLYFVYKHNGVFMRYMSDIQKTIKHFMINNGNYMVKLPIKLTSCLINITSYYLILPKHSVDILTANV
jgi:hypothetical protein